MMCFIYLVEQEPNCVFTQKSLLKKHINSAKIQLKELDSPEAKFKSRLNSQDRMTQ